MDPNDPSEEAERCLGIAAKLLTARDFLGSKTFAFRARESNPNNPLPDQILAVIDTVLAGEKRLNPSQQPNWYSVLQIPRLVHDSQLIANNYRQLVMLLSPDRNRFPFADYAYQLVTDAWSVLSDPTKKWLFDNELAIFLQQVEQQPQPVRVEPVRVQQQHQLQFEPLQSGVISVPSSTSVSNATANSNSQNQINTLQFLQPQSLPQQPMWQQHLHIQQQQMQREIMSSSPPPVHRQQQKQVVSPQWQMRDPTLVNGNGERSRGVVDGNRVGGVTLTEPGAVLTPTPIPTPEVAVPVQPVSTQVVQRTVTVAQPAVTRVTPKPPVWQQQQAGRAGVAASVRTTVVVNGNGNANSIGSAGNVANSVSDYNDLNVNHSSNGHRSENVVVNEIDINAAGGNAANEKDGGVVGAVETFWTACPYCFYTYEYQKMYQDCTLRCQHCRRGFHAVQIPNPPPISGSNGGGGGGEGVDKDKESSFCCWGFFPLGFSLTAWKKQNQMRKGSVLPNWVPFSPMFTSPVQNGDGDGNFQWFANNGVAAAGPKNFGRKPLSTPRVYIDDDVDFLAYSDSSGSDLSDGDWRNPSKVKRKKRKRGNIGRPKVGRPRKVQPETIVVHCEENQNSASGGGVSVSGEKLQDASETQDFIVGSKEDKTKKMTVTLTRNQARRRAKNMGRLDLNVEFNNEGDEHAPSGSAVHGAEDGIENIAFFDGLDEFLSTLPILNVGGEEKAKAS